MTNNKWDVYKYSNWQIDLFNKMLKKYPNVLSSDKTFEKVVKNNLSFIRIGDGELDLIIGKNNYFNKNNPELANRLKEICEKGSDDKCLVCMNDYKSEINHKWWIYHGITNMEKIVEKISFADTDFGDAYFLFKYLLIDKKVSQSRINNVKNLWNGKKVLFVCNQNSLLRNDTLGLFDKITEREFLTIPDKNSFDLYDEILLQTKKYSNDWVIYLEVGPTAKLLAYDLYPLGYKVLDMGGFYDRLKNIDYHIDLFYKNK